MDKDRILELLSDEARRRRCHPLRVFVSSTFKDLKKERQAVKNALSMCGCVPVLAENAPMQPGKGLMGQIQFWLSDIDLLVLLVCERYGETSPSKSSWTKLEVEEAMKMGKPVFSYFVKGRIPAGMEWNEQKRKRLEDFKSWLNRLPDQQPPQHTKNLQELVIRVSRDVGALQSDYRAEAMIDIILREVDRERDEGNESYYRGFLG